LLEACGLWAQGQRLDDMAIYGIPMLAVGRLGKIVSFLASIVAVIDIIGPDQIRRWARRASRGELDLYIGRPSSC
jgi:sorbitol-specific phosphotransferase system component IIC